MVLERVEHCVDVVRVAGDRRLDELVLGLEVVVDVADRDVGRPCDVGDRCGLDALLMKACGVRPATKRSRLPCFRRVGESVISLKHCDAIQACPNSGMRVPRARGAGGAGASAPAVEVARTPSRRAVAIVRSQLAWFANGPRSITGTDSSRPPYCTATIVPCF